MPFQPAQPQPYQAVLGAVPGWGLLLYWDHMNRSYPPGADTLSRSLPATVRGSCFPCPSVPHDRGAALALCSRS